MSDEPTERDMEALLAEHEPVLGVFGKRAGIVGCSCLSARDYRAAGHGSGQRGWRAHLAAMIAERIAEARREGAREALEQAVDTWQFKDWSNVLLPKPEPPAVPVIAYSNSVLDWLRERAAAVRSEAP